MQSIEQVSAKFGIPVHYQCSKCNTTVNAVIPVSGAGATNRQGYVNFEGKCEMIDKAQTDARKMVEASVRNHYTRDALHHCQNIIGQCPHCGNLEAWQKDPKKAARAEKLMNIFVKAGMGIAFVGAVVVGACTSNFWFGALTFVAVLALLIVSLILLDKILAQKDINKNPIGFMNKAGVPEASRPQYTLTLEQILPRLDTDIQYR